MKGSVSSRGRKNLRVKQKKFDSESRVKRGRFIIEESKPSDTISHPSENEIFRGLSAEQIAQRLVSGVPDVSRRERANPSRRSRGIERE